uniref:Uncharacterized protein n=1 Tax=Amphiprion ocellaris TaxID=80972 RepID=A0AAQ5XP99_AMPOC
LKLFFKRLLKCRFLNRVPVVDSPISTQGSPQPLKPVSQSHYGNAIIHQLHYFWEGLETYLSITYRLKPPENLFFLLFRFNTGYHIFFRSMICGHLMQSTAVCKFSVTSPVILDY